MTDAMLTWDDKYGHKNVLEQGKGNDIFFANIDEEGMHAEIIDKDKLIEFVEMLKEDEVE